MGRGEKNKRGTSGQGASNQSNQPFVTTEENHRKSNHGKRQTGGKPSEPSPRTVDQDAQRDLPLKPGKVKRKR